MCAAPSCTTCASAAASRPASRKSWPTARRRRPPPNKRSPPSERPPPAPCSRRFFFLPMTSIDPSLPPETALSKIPGFDPRSAPVVGIDGQLAPVPPERLTADALRERFTSPPAWEPEIVAERRFTNRPKMNAAVLVPIVLRERPMVLLTERATHLSTHSGQVAFPG